MPSIKLSWTHVSKHQFDELRQRAVSADKSALFINNHNKIVRTLSDLDQAIEKGEPLFNTIKPGGEVRKWVCDFVCVSYAIFRHERVAWVLKYLPVPSTWPELA